jgi:hypothetical protein
MNPGQQRRSTIQSGRVDCKEPNLLLNVLALITDLNLLFCRVMRRKWRV